MRRKHILHLHSSFDLGGKEARAVRLMNAFGDAARHTVLSSVATALGARAAIDPAVTVAFPDDAPPLHGKPGIGRYYRLARYMRGFDLVLSYNWGAMDGVAAHRLFAPATPLPPLIHHEDGFNADETERLDWKRNIFRRLTFPTLTALAVPSQGLARIATDRWGMDDARLHRIGNGIAVSDYTARPGDDAIPGLARRQGEVVIGTLAGLRPVKNLCRLVRCVAPIPQARLVIVGEGPEREAIVAEAAALGIGDRLVMPGFLPDPARYVGAFDLFALSSDSEQFPIALVEAMATGLAVAAPAVGDIAAMVAPENTPFITQPYDERALAEALAALAADASLRARIGVANRARAKALFDDRMMIARYAALYGIEAG